LTPTLLVLAAGIGSRYGGLKQMDPVGPSGEIIIDYSIYDAIKAGFKKVVFLIREDLQEAFDEKFENLKSKIEIDYAFQSMDLPAGYPEVVTRKKPWGTGHAVLCAKDKIMEPFAVINADDYYGREAYQTIVNFLNTVDASSSKLQFALVGYELQKTLSDFGQVSRGIGITNDSDELISITEYHGLFMRDGEIFYETPDHELEEISSKNVSMNFWGFVPGIFQELEIQFKEFVLKNTSNPKAEFFLPSAVDRLIKSGKAVTKVIRSSSQWFGVTYKEDKPIVQREIKKLIDQNIYPSPLW